MVRNLLYTFLIALTNNFDNIGARVAYSLRGIKIGTPVNLWISVITFVISFFAAISGTMLSGSLGKRVSSVTAMVLLVAIGCWMILEPYMKKRRDRQKPAPQDPKNIYAIFLEPEKADMDDSKHIDFKEATLLGIALSLNNIGGGLSAGMIGLDALLVGFLSALISFVALWAGNHVAEYLIRKKVTEKVAVLGGILLIAIGIEQLFQL